MMKTILLATTLSLLLCPVLHAQKHAKGEILKEVRCEGDRKYSYVLYLPSGYNPDRKEGWPVLFAMSPGGGSAGALKRYVPGAEKNNWILAMSIQSKNGMEGKRAIKPMVEDVFDRFHVDEKRCYATGFSGGAREAFLLASAMKSNIIGIIPCGAGGEPSGSRLLAYGLCGSSCFNRWDMATTFDKIRTKNGQLRFFPGGHSWAGKDLCFDAITWLNGQYLAKKGTPAEINAYSKMLIDEIKRKLENDPYFAYEHASLLAGIKKAPAASEANRMVAQLLKDPRIKKYIEGLEEMDDFVDEHFNTDVMDYRNNPCTSSQKSDAKKLAATYADTPLAKTIEGFGKPSKKF